MSNILVVGLNPAWQKTLQFDHLEVGGVNRACAMHLNASGKGLNAARVLRRFGHQVSLLQIVGGANGEKITAACGEEGIISLAHEVTQETRVCTTLIDREQQVETEIIDPFLVEQEGEAMVGALLERIDKGCGKPDALVFCGQAPDGCPEDVYDRILAHVRPEYCVLDAYKNVGLGLFNAVNALKINRNELEHLESRFNGFFPELEKGHCSRVMATDGAGRACLYERNNPGGKESGEKWHKTIYTLPVLEKVKNPIGAGDTVTAGITHYTLLGNAYRDAFAKALAMGSASCLTLIPCEFHQEDYQRVLGNIQVAGMTRLG